MQALSYCHATKEQVSRPTLGKALGGRDGSWEARGGEKQGRDGESLD